MFAKQGAFIVAALLFGVEATTTTKSSLRGQVDKAETANGSRNLESCPNRPDLVNLSMNRPTTQSSTWPHEHRGDMLTSENAVDGDINTMQHTFGEGDTNWWRVQLEDGASVDEVTLYKRVDCPSCLNRYKKFYVTLKKDGVVVAEHYQEDLMEDGMKISFCAEEAD